MPAGLRRVPRLLCEGRTGGGPAVYRGGVVRPCTLAPEAVDGLPVGAAPVPPGSSGDGRERTLDVLRAGGLRFRAGGRWRTGSLI